MFVKLTQGINCPIGENSPDLATLVTTWPKNLAQNSKSICEEKRKIRIQTRGWGLGLNVIVFGDFG
jgi:hypothetical protein